MGRDYSERLTGWLLAGLIAGVPLIVVPSGFDPFGPAKWLVVSTIGLTVAAVVLLRKHVAVQRGWTVGWLAFVVWGAVASVVAVDPVYTWIGTPDRHLGLFSWLVFSVLFLAGATLHGRAAVQPLLKASVVALTGIGVYAGLELVGVAPVELSSTADRIGGPFGSAAYLGAATALLLPIVVGAAVDGLASMWWRRVALAASVLGGVAALGAQTRAGWIGLIVAAAIVVPAARPWIASRRAVIAGAGVALVVVAIATPIGGRVASAFDFDSGGARGRIDEWRVGAAVMAEHSITGLGFEGYRIGFAEGVDAEYERRYGRVFTPDRAHNGALDVGLTAGAPGLGLYVAGAVALLVAAVRAVRSREPWLIGIAAGVAGYVAQQQFLFPLAEVDPLFWVFAGVVVAATSPLRSVSIPPGLWLIPTALAAAALVAGGLNVAADQAARRAIDFEQRGDVAAAAEHASTAVSRRPDSIRYGFVAAGIAGRLGTSTGLRSAVDRLHDALVISPEDPILRAARAGFELDLAVVERDGAALSDAIAQWEALVARDPHHAQNRLELGIAYAFGGRGDDAEREWLAATGLAPGSTAPWINLATLYLDSGRAVDAAAAIDHIQGLDPGSSVLVDLVARLEAQGRENG